MFMKGKTPLRFLAPILFGLATSSVLADQVVNGGFETGTFSGWTVSDSSGFTNIGPDPLFAHSGTYHANLGARGTIGTLTQNVVTTPGQSYTLSFWLANDSSVPPNSFDVFWNGASVLALSNASSFDYTLYSFNVMATGASTQLQFQYRNDDDFFRLDDVSVEVVPEPQALWLIVAGTAVFFGARRISRKRRA